MSVDTDEQKLQDESEIEQISAEQLADAGAEAVESSTQDDAEVVAEQIDLKDLAGEAKTQDDEQAKAHNAKMASERRYLSKQLEKKREQLNQVDQQLKKGEIPQGYEFKPQNEVSSHPNLDDYKARLDDDFEGDTNLMLAYYNEDIRKHNEAIQRIEEQRKEHIGRSIADVDLKRQNVESYAKKVEEFRAIVPNIDDGIESLNERLEARYGDIVGNNIIDAVRDYVGENSPLVLAAIGANNENYNGLVEASAKSNHEVYKFLTRLEDKLMSNLPSAKTISTAASETPVDGGGALGDNFDKILKDIESGKGKYSGMSRFQRAQEKRSVERQRRAAN